jgi:hypothetical protein
VAAVRPGVNRMAAWGGGGQIEKRKVPQWVANKVFQMCAVGCKVSRRACACNWR